MRHCDIIESYRTYGALATLLNLHLPLLLNRWLVGDVLLLAGILLLLLILLLTTFTLLVLGSSCILSSLLSSQSLSTVVLRRWLDNGLFLLGLDDSD